MVVECCPSFPIWCLLLSLSVLNGYVCLSVHSTQTILDDSKHVNIPGNVMLGGLVAVHDAGGQNDLHCNSNISAYGIQRVEAMKYAVAKVNEEWKETGLKLGITIRDSCGSETKALDESLQFVVNRLRVCKKDNDTVPMFGVVGASMSLLTGVVANLLRLFQIPLISYAATSEELSDQNKYDYLLRTVPPDSRQSGAMVDFITKHLKWDSVFIIYSVGSYGEYGYDSFVEAARNNDESPCIVGQKRVKPNISKVEMEEILNEFKRNFPNVTGIVCYCELPDVKTLIQTIASNTSHYHFKLIGSDASFSGTKSTNTVVFSLHYNYSCVKDFYENWYSKLKPDDFQDGNSSKNPWFQEFWNDACSRVRKGSHDNRTDCTSVNFGLCKSDTTDLTCRKDDKVPYTIDAVYAFANAIRNLLSLKFQNQTSELLKVDFKNLTFLNDYLRKVEFNGLSGRVHFNTSVKRGSYDISRYNSSSKRFVSIGRWENGLLTDIVDEITKDFGQSTCRDTCKRNEKKVYQVKRCCWKCEECRNNQYVFANESCITCNYSQKPKSTYTGCEDIEIRYLSLYWKIIIGVLSTLGISLTLFIIKTFISNNNSPLVKASGREMTYIQLAGILLLFCMPLVFLAKPTETLCAVARVSFGVLICLCYSSLLVKTNRIARIFTGRQDLSFLTPSWQLIFTCCLMVPQMFITVYGFKSHPNSTCSKYFKLEFGVKMCKPDTVDLIATMIYNLLLVFLCTYYAFRTRKVPANFNEARYIGFVMYTTCVIWLAFLPVYFGTDLKYNTVFVLVFMVAITFVVGLFGMKMYILIYRPDKNSLKSSKLRPITVSSSGETSFYCGDKYSQMPSPRNVRFHKSVTDTTLVSDYRIRTETKNEIESSFTIDNNTDNRTSKLDRGTSTTDDSGISENSDEVFHETLHKTMTI